MILNDFESHSIEIRLGITDIIGNDMGLSVDVYFDALIDIIDKYTVEHVVRIRNLGGKVWCGVNGASWSLDERANAEFLKKHYFQIKDHAQKYVHEHSLDRVA